MYTYVSSLDPALHSDSDAASSKLRLRLQENPVQYIPFNNHCFPLGIPGRNPEELKTATQEGSPLEG